MPEVMILISKKRMIKLWASLVIEDYEEAYYQLYGAMTEDEGADEWHPFDAWWTEEEGMKVLEEVSEARNASQKKEAEIKSLRVSYVQTPQATGVLAEGPREA